MEKISLVDLVFDYALGGVVVTNHYDTIVVVFIDTVNDIVETFVTDFYMVVFYFISDFHFDMWDDIIAIGQSYHSI